MEVHWDAERRCLYSPKPREWTYARWFEQIRNAAREQSVDLKLVQATEWFGVDAELQRTLIASDLDF
jgi:hypothetical protein